MAAAAGKETVSLPSSREGKEDVGRYYLEKDEAAVDDVLRVRVLEAIGHVGEGFRELPEVARAILLAEYRRCLRLIRCACPRALAQGTREAPESLDDARSGARRRRLRRRGGGFLALHNATGFYPESGPYLDLLGGTYEGHGPLESFRVRVAGGDHPVTQGVAENEVADEQRTPRPDLTEVRVILESRSGDGVTAATGWMRKVGKDRVAYLANHHTRDALGQPTFRLLVANAMRWSLRREQ